MAEGILLVLVNEENNEREKYLGLDKEYEFEMLLGIETDTYDILGKVQKLLLEKVSAETIKETTKKYQRTFLQSFPPFSSQPVHGKPLHHWARTGKLSQIKIPEKEVTVFTVDIHKVRFESGKIILQQIHERISRVEGDFRQAEILALWDSTLQPYLEEQFCIASGNVYCSSGTYIRSLVHNIGKDLKIGACLYFLKRISIGKETVNSSA
jgi:tRNA pseudouridine55 synthase